MIRRTPYEIRRTIEGLRSFEWYSEPEAHIPDFREAADILEAILEYRLEVELDECIWANQGSPNLSFLPWFGEKYNPEPPTEKQKAHRERQRQGKINRNRAKAKNSEFWLPERPGESVAWEDVV